MLEPLSQVPWKWEGLKSDCDDVLWTTTFNIQSTLHTIYIPTTTQARSTNNNTTTTQWPSTKLSSVEFCLHMTTTTLVFGRGLSYNRGGKLVCVKWWGPHAFQGSYVISTTLEGEHAGELCGMLGDVVSMFLQTQNVLLHNCVPRTSCIPNETFYIKIRQFS